jgi:hypothetical protein
MAAPGYLDIFCHQGATFNTAITLTDVNNSPMNLANLTISSVVKKSYITSNIAATFIVSKTNSIGGVVTLTLPYKTTANLSPRRYVYDVVSFDTTSNTVNRILEGTMYLVPGTTIVP